MLVPARILKSQNHPALTLIGVPHAAFLLSVEQMKQEFITGETRSGGYAGTATPAVLRDKVETSAVRSNELPIVCW